MFREMRRKNQALDAQACSAVLDRGTSGVLAVLGDEGYPYAVPLSYVREGDRLYFCRWVEDPEYREEMVVRSFPTGEVLEVLPGTMWEMPDGQKWILQ